jgi:RNA polymerase sigma-70 factor (ECF subfamily)
VTWPEQQRKFAEWAEAYDAILWKTARSFATGADQDDLHQELLLAMWKAIPLFRGESSVSTFVYRVAYNHAIGWSRKRKQDDVHVDYARHSLTAQAVNAHTDAESRVEWLYEQIRALPPLDRALILLYLDGVSYREMSDVSGLSESNVGVRLNRMKKQLAQRLKEVTRA